MPHIRISWTLALLFLLVACQAPSTVEVRTWGTIRQALRDGESGGRVALEGLGGRGVIGVGALADLAGEVTIVDDRVLVAEVDGGVGVVRESSRSDQATVLIRAAVSDWRGENLPDCASYAELDAAIGKRVRERGFDPSKPVPVRIRGRGLDVAFHVIAGACPIANPDGPEPWRFEGPIDSLELVGVYVEGAAGRLTHHTNDSHLHVVAKGKMGHLDELRLCDAMLYLPPAPRVR